MAEFTDAVGDLLRVHGADAIHANYWLSGLAGHRLKHELDIPLIMTFHTLERVKAERWGRLRTTVRTRRPRSSRAPTRCWRAVTSKPSSSCASTTRTPRACTSCPWASSTPSSPRAIARRRGAR